MPEFDPNSIPQETRKKLDPGILMELMGVKSGGKVLDNRLKVLVVYSGDIETLKAAGLDAGVDAHGVVTGTVSLDQVVGLADLENVEKIDLSYPVKRELDGSVPAIHVDQVHSGDPSRKGNGVVVGIIDSGIDFMHKSFRDGDGKTRISRIWDQTLTAQSGESAPTAISGASGVEYTTTDIDFTIDTNEGRTPSVSGQLVRHADVDSNGDPEGHGTHVAGIAAGDGSQPGNCHGGDTYVGVAPQAEIIMVKYDDFADVADAVTYIFTVADDKPCVINISLGTDFGGAGIDAHDGTHAVEQRIDNELNTAAAGDVGRAVVKSAGNSANDGRHASAVIGANGNGGWTFNVPAGDSDTNFLGIWYAGAARLDFTLTDPNGNSQGPVSPGNTTTLNFPDGTRAFINSQLNMPPATDVSGSPRNMHNIQIALRTPSAGGNILAGDWVIALQETAGNETTAHCWIGDSGDVVATFVEADQDLNSTITIPGTAANIITVAAYDHDSGELADFSSRGPTIDGRQKPDITAPGVAIASVKNQGSGGICSDCCYSFYIDKQGTSMAAPHVTGVVALMMEKNPEISFRLIRRFITENHTTPDGVNDTDLPTDEWGHGIVNALEAVNNTIAPASGSGGGGAAAPVSSSPMLYTPNRFIEWPVPQFRKTLHRLNETLLQSEQGQLLSALISMHFDEVFRLITTNRRVGATWQRNFGPKLVQYLLRHSRSREFQLPDRLEGRDAAASMERFLQVVSRYASDTLQNDIQRFAPFVKSIWGQPIGSLGIKGNRRA